PRIDPRTATPPPCRRPGCPRPPPGPSCAPPTCPAPISSASGVSPRVAPFSLVPGIALVHIALPLLLGSAGHRYPRRIETILARGLIRKFLKVVPKGQPRSPRLPFEFVAQLSTNADSRHTHTKSIFAIQSDRKTLIAQFRAPQIPPRIREVPQPAATASSPAGSRIVTSEPRIVISPSSTKPARRRLRVSAVVPSREAMAFFGSGSRTRTTRWSASPCH